MNQRTISVIIPFYRRFEKVHRAINSVLEQTLPAYEIILVDDASYQDHFFSTSAYRDCRIQLLRHDENKGPGASRNTGLAVAQGEFICFLDSDDYWDPRFLEVCLEGLQRDPEVAFAYAYSWEVQNGRHIGFRNKNDRPYKAILPNILDGGRPWGTCSCLWRKSIVEKVGAWMPLRAWEDFNFEARASVFSNRVVCVDEPLCYIEKTDLDQKVPPLTPKGTLLDQNQALVGIIAAIQQSPLKEDPEILTQLRMRSFSVLMRLLDQKQFTAAESLAGTIQKNKLCSFGQLALIRLALISRWSRWISGCNFLERRRNRNRKKEWLKQNSMQRKLSNSWSEQSIQKIL